MGEQSRGISDWYRPAFTELVNLSELEDFEKLKIIESFEYIYFDCSDDLIVAALIKAMSKDPLAIFYFDECYFVCMDETFRSCAMTLRNRHDGNRIKFRNEMTPSNNLDGDEARDFFFLVEITITKLIHFYSNVKIRKKSTFGQTIEILLSLGIISKNSEDIIIKLRDVRNEYAHSDKKISEIYYGKSKIQKNPGQKKTPFWKDIFSLTEEILMLFRKKQSTQIDTRILRTFFLEGKSIESFRGPVFCNWVDYGLIEAGAPTFIDYGIDI